MPKGLALRPLTDQAARSRASRPLSRRTRPHRRVGRDRVPGAPGDTPPVIARALGV